MGESNFTNNELCVSVFEKPQLKVVDTDASVFSWSVKSFEQQELCLSKTKKSFGSCPRQLSLCSGRCRWH